MYGNLKNINCVCFFSQINNDLCYLLHYDRYACVFACLVKHIIQPIDKFPNDKRTKILNIPEYKWLWLKVRCRILHRYFYNFLLFIFGIKYEPFFFFKIVYCVCLFSFGMTILRLVNKFARFSSFQNAKFAFFSTFQNNCCHYPYR